MSAEKLELHYNVEEVVETSNLCRSLDGSTYDKRQALPPITIPYTTHHRHHRPNPHPIPLLIGAVKLYEIRRDLFPIYKTHCIRIFMLSCLK